MRRRSRRPRAAPAARRSSTARSPCRKARSSSLTFTTSARPIAATRFATYARPIGDDGGTGIHVDHHHGVVVQPAEVFDDGRGHRFECQRQPAGEEQGIGWQLTQRARRQVGGGCSVEVEAVRRAAVLVELGRGERRRPFGAPTELRVHPIGFESGGEQRAEPIDRQRAGEARRRPEARRRACRVVRRTPERRGDRSIRSDDEIDERLADHGDHCRRPITRPVRRAPRRRCRRCSPSAPPRPWCRPSPSAATARPACWRRRR